MKTLLFGPLSIIFVIVILGISGFMASVYVAPLIGLNGWMAGILIALVQMAFVTALGLFSGLKLSLTQILLGSLLIFSGAVAAGFLGDWFALPRDYMILVTVCFQAILLQFLGVSWKKR